MASQAPDSASSNMAVQMALKIIEEELSKSRNELNELDQQMENRRIALRCIDSEAETAKAELAEARARKGAVLEEVESRYGDAALIGATVIEAVYCALTDFGHRYPRRGRDKEDADALVPAIKVARRLLAREDVAAEVRRQLTVKPIASGNAPRLTPASTAGTSGSAPVVAPSL